MTLERIGEAAACAGCGSVAVAGHAWRGGSVVVCSACAAEGLAGVLAVARDAAQPLPSAARACSSCEMLDPPARQWVSGDLRLCADCLLACADALVARPRAAVKATNPPPIAADLLVEHFVGHDVNALSSQTRLFPTRMHADVQAGLDAALGTPTTGVRRQFDIETLDFPALLVRDEHYCARLAPVQMIEIDVGDAEARRCMKCALWLFREGGEPLAVLFATRREYGREQGLHLEVAAPQGPAGEARARALFERVEAAIKGSTTYRGKVLSLEKDGAHYEGKAMGIKVHRLRKVARDEVILGEDTLRLLERNVFGFHAQRARLRALGLPVKKGLLFHGPPGTGKTHTIHYVASQLEGHTTLLMTAEQVAHLDEYMSLARLLQPSMIVIEDADLIARDRETMRVPGEEVLLNKLLNEMDGLREDAEVLFVLSTNRPDALEPALAMRPGRIDQAIAFPLPDEDGRKRLIGLYARGLALQEGVIDDVARRTEGASAAFIKELMRRTAQASIERGSEVAEAVDVELALEDMLFAGGALNVRLLGGVAPVGP